MNNTGIKYNDEKEYAEFLKKHNVSANVYTEEIVRYDRLSIDVLNDHNWDEIAETYEREKLVVIDNFLKPEYAERLRKFYLFFPRVDDLWYDYAGLNFSKEPDKVWFPLLTNITEDIKKSALFLKDKEIMQIWAFIYNNSALGTPVHSDHPASTNFNLWVTPEESMNMSDDHNGLTIWKIPPPDDWGPRDYNCNILKINRYLAEQDPPKVKIPYKFNRVTIFHSRFFHKSYPVSSKPGYENRRINYTFLFK